MASQSEESKLEMIIQCLITKTRINVEAWCPLNTTNKKIRAKLPQRLDSLGGEGVREISGAV